jgi:hypothetical protein
MLDKAGHGEFALGRLDRLAVIAIANRNLSIQPLSYTIPKVVLRLRLWPLWPERPR